MSALAEEFLSTLPVRGATQILSPQRGQMIFLSTLPVRGATAAPLGQHPTQAHFYPRSP